MVCELQMWIVHAYIVWLKDDEELCEMYYHEIGKSWYMCMNWMIWSIGDVIWGVYKMYIYCENVVLKWIWILNEYDVEIWKPLEVVYEIVRIWNAYVRHKHTYCIHGRNGEEVELQNMRLKRDRNLKCGHLYRNENKCAFLKEMRFARGRESQEKKMKWDLQGGENLRNGHSIWKEKKRKVK